MFNKLHIMVIITIGLGLLVGGCPDNDEEVVIPEDPDAAPEFELEPVEPEPEPEPEPVPHPPAYTPPPGPDFQLPTFYADTEPIALEDFQGQIVVLEWFSHECPFVVYHYEEANTMLELAERYEDDGVVWLAVDSSANVKAADVLEYIEEHDIPYPILDDRSGEVGKAYGATRTPEMFIIDGDGYIVYQGAIDNAPLGNVPEDEEYINYVEQALDELLAGQEVSIPQTDPYGCTVKY